MALDLNDKTANGNTLTNSGAAEVTTSLPFAQSTEAVDLKLSESDYLWAADSTSLSIAGNLTVECWVKFGSFPATTISLVTKYTTGTGGTSYAFVLAGNANPALINLVLLYSTNGDYQAANDARVTWASPNTGQWYHLAVTYTASSADVKFYVDGSQQETTQTKTGTSIYDSTTRVALGAVNTEGTPGSFLDGILDDVRIWNIVRTDFSDRSQQLTGSESGLVAYWPFEVLIGGHTLDLTSKMW